MVLKNNPEYTAHFHEILKNANPDAISRLAPITPQQSGFDSLFRTITRHIPNMHGHKPGHFMSLVMSLASVNSRMPKRAL